MGTVNHSTDYTVRLRRDLTTLVGPEDANVLIANLSDEAGLLPSLGPVIGLARVAQGEMKREAYLAQYGHRGPHEFEISVPRPAEEPDWLDRQLAQFRDSPVDAQALLTQQRETFDATWQRFLSRYPRQAKAMRRRIAESTRRARLREEARSEYVRDRWLVRTFALRAGELTGLGDDISNSCASLPAIASGDGDPNVIVGSPGAAGRVEGVVRRLDKAEDGDQLREGEVLVTMLTDIAWTLLFPRAVAIVTDVGAPLSHAAIVARELGIPAVVGCGDATIRLRTGDRMRVDGGRGTVEILREV